MHRGRVIDDLVEVEVRKLQRLLAGGRFSDPSSGFRGVHPRPGRPSAPGSEGQPGVFGAPTSSTRSVACTGTGATSSTS